MIYAIKLTLTTYDNRKKYDVVLNLFSSKDEALEAAKGITSNLSNDNRYRAVFALITPVSRLPKRLTAKLLKSVS